MLETLINLPLPKCKSMDKETISSESLSKEVAYLLGVYLTDGYITGEGKFLLQVIDEDFAATVLCAIKKIKSDCTASVFTRENLKGGRDKKPQFCVSAGFTSLRPFFENQTGKKHHIPFVIWDAPLAIKKWFIAGIMDGDGYVAYHTRPNGDLQWTVGVGKVEEGWIFEFKELLEKMGVKVLKPYRFLTKNGVPFVTFNINPTSFKEHGLFFTIGRKQDRVKLLRSVQRLNAPHPTG